MKLGKWLMASWLLGVVTASPVWAQFDVANNITSPNSGFVGAMSATGQGQAQSFQTGSSAALLHSVQLRMIRYSGTAVGLVQVRRDNAGVPGTLVESLGNLSVTSLADTTYTISASGNSTLSPNTKYWVAIYHVSGDFGWALTVNSGSSGAGFVLDDDSFTFNNGGTWGGDTPGERFKLSVRAVFPPVTRYVNKISANPQSPFTNFATAATSIQAAVDVAVAGDTILVAPGEYNSGGRVAPGMALTNRVLIDKAVTVRSISGPEVTFILGKKLIGLNAVRGVWLGAGARLEGFSIELGGTLATNTVAQEDRMGGGVFCQSNSSVVVNCRFVGNHAQLAGGAVYGGTIIDSSLLYNDASFGGAAMESTLAGCWIIENSAELFGGAIYGCTVDRSSFNGNYAKDGGGAVYLSRVSNSLLIYNFAYGAGAYGGGALGSSLTNCTLAFNRAANGGGVADCSVQNSIVYFNTKFLNSTVDNYLISTIGYSCATPLPDGAGNISTAPQFVDTPAGNFRLMANSPGINAGNNAVAAVPFDRDGRKRIVGGVVDMGAYEFGTATPSDFNADGTADLPVFNPANGAWYVRNVTPVSTVTWNNQWGWSTARPLVGDYNGDGASDLAVFDTQGGFWYVRSLPNNTITWRNQWGWSTAKPVAGDYDGDGIWDQAVFDTQGGFWYIKRITGEVIAWRRQWGWSTAKPVAGDYNGDGKFDLTVFDTQGGFWYSRSLDNRPIAWKTQWGWSTAKPVPGDYNGDGNYDFAVYDEATGFWYIRKVGGGNILWRTQWGWPGAKPVSGDFNGDGIFDLAVVDTSNGRWYIREVSGPTILWKSNWGWGGASFPTLGD